MKHTDMRLEETMIMMERYKINPTELLLAQILLLYQDAEEKTLVKQYFSLSDISRGGTRDLLVSLQNKGIITKDYIIPEKGQKLDPLEISFNKTFVKNLYKSSFSLGKELFDAYPISCIVNGVEYKLRRVSKKYDSLEDCFSSYGKAIHWNEETHHEVLELIEWGKNNGYNFTVLADFIVDHDWNNIKAMRDNGLLSTSQLKQI